jgi:hypothetical protein
MVQNRSAIDIITKCKAIGKSVRNEISWLIREYLNRNEFRENVYIRLYTRSFPIEVNRVKKIRHHYFQVGFLRHDNNREMKHIISH